MGDHEATGPAGHRLLVWLERRVKAVIGAITVLVVGAVASAVHDPDASGLIANVLPEYLRPYVPWVLGGIGVVLLERIPNRPLRSQPDAENDPAEDAGTEETTDVS